MIRVNLIRGKRKKRKEFRAESLYLLLPVLVLAGLFLFHRNATARIETLTADIQRANVEIERLKKEIGEVEKFKARKAELQQKVDVIAGLQKNRGGPLRILEGISATIPEKCWIDQVAVKGNSVTLSGVALNNHTVANFMTALGESGRFGNVTLGSADQTTVQGNKLVKFNLTFSSLVR